MNGKTEATNILEFYVMWFFLSEEKSTEQKLVCQVAWLYKKKLITIKPLQLTTTS